MKLTDEEIEKMNIDICKEADSYEGTTTDFSSVSE